jgi:hypothetical protein
VRLRFWWRSGGQFVGRPKGIYISFIIEQRVRETTEEKAGLIIILTVGLRLRCLGVVDGELGLNLFGG